jgi:hypothetical protein
MRDIELGRVDTVMFTELSRLSRFLKDFLNIFVVVANLAQPADAGRKKALARVRRAFRSQT